MPTYTKTTWVNGSAPAVNATNLNKIETGIETATPLTGQVATGTTSWTTTTTAGFARFKDVAIAGVTATMYPEVFFTAASYTIAQDAEIGPYCETYAGGIRLFAQSIPTGTVTFDYVVVRG